jgi:teichuronic acid biosynthesis glycosyltransferase TuaC
MKVLVVIPGEEHGTSMIFAKKQVEDLKELGIRVSTFFLRSRTSPKAILSESKRLKKLIAEVKPDLVHCHYGTMTSLLTVMSTSVPAVVTFHGSDLNKASDISELRSFLGRLFSQLSALKASRIIVVNQRMVNRLWWSKSKALVLPMGIDTDTFVELDRNECKRKLGLDITKKYIFFNASNPLIKRLDIAEKTEAEVKKLIPEAELLMLKGGTDPALVPVYLNACSCLLMCSDSEGSPMVVKEALSCNIPVVSSDVGDVKERIDGVKNSFIVDRDPASLANAIVGIIRSDERSDGRKKIEEFSSKIISLKLKQIYEDVLKNKSGVK